MRIIAYILAKRVVRAILEHLSLWDVPRPQPPPVADVEPADWEYVPGEDLAPLAAERRGRSVFPGRCCAGRVSSSDALPDVAGRQGRQRERERERRDRGRVAERVLQRRTGVV
jgi:hypothetical protein